MTTDLLFKHFHLLADTPGGVQKLRELILQLAVQGKLVPQNQKDAPASELLEEIEAEKQRLVNEGKIKKQKQLPEIKPEEVPFELPEGWEWGKLINVGYWALGSGFPLSYQGIDKGDYLFCKVGDMNLPENERYIRKTKNYISKEILKKIKAKIHPPGTIIFPKIGGAIATNKRRILAKYSAIDNNCLGVTPFNAVNTDWLFIQLLALDFTQYQSGTSLPALSQGVLANIIIGVPPLREQHRIVSKVDQLMALCDELEAKKEKQQTTHTRLNKSALHALRESRTRDELIHNWTRIKNNFHHLFTTPEAIQELRSTILQLAVQGRLVPQNPDDEPASMLLEKIREEKKQLIKEGQIKKQKPLPEIRPEEVPFEVPQGWVWVRFQDLGIFGRGKSKHRPRNDPVLYKDGNIPVVQTGDIARANGHVKTYTGLYNQKGLSQSTLWPKGTLCITIAANIADSAILSFDSCFPDSVVGFVPSAYINDARYFDYFMRTTKKDLLSYAPSTAQKNINLGILNQLLIPLPPQQELKRIVAKVDHLMSFCEELESNLFQSQTDGEKLMEAVVAELSEQNIMTGSMRMANANNHLPVSSACSG